MIPPHRFKPLRERLTSRRTWPIAIGVVLGTLVIFVAMGNILGKTVENSSIRTADTRLASDPRINALALPYEYVTAPIAALNELIGTTPALPQRAGCALLGPVCEGLKKAGAPVTPEPQIRPYTSTPFPWNTYTALDRPLIDGGLVLAIPILFLLGVLNGIAYRLAIRGYLVAVCLYAILGSAVLFSVAQFNFCAPHILGGMLLVIASLGIARATLGTGTERRPAGRNLPAVS